MLYAIGGFFLILKAELVRSFIIMRRYWFAALIGLSMGFAMIGGAVKMVITLGGTNALDNLSGYVSLVLGFFIGVFAFGIVGMFTQGIQGMARTGELEQVCLSPYGLVVNFLARSFVSSVNSIANSAIMLGLVAHFVAPGSLHFAPAATVALLGLTYLNLIGFGFMVGGLVLIFKDVGPIAMILRFILIGLATFSTFSETGPQAWPAPARAVAHVLPVTDASRCLRYTLIDGQQLPVLDAEGSPEFLLDENGQKMLVRQETVLDKRGKPVMDAEGKPEMKPVYKYKTYFSSVFHQPSFFFFLISCMLWTTIGIACFRYCENWSRDKGTLGAY